MEQHVGDTSFPPHAVSGQGRAAGQQASRPAGHRAQGTGQRAQGTGHKAQGTGHRAQGTGGRAGHTRPLDSARCRFQMTGFRVQR